MPENVCVFSAALENKCGGLLLEMPKNNRTVFV